MLGEANFREEGCLVFLFRSWCLIERKKQKEKLNSKNRNMDKEVTEGDQIQ